jgi:hypothetical protein
MGAAAGLRLMRQLFRRGPAVAYPVVCTSIVDVTVRATPGSLSSWLIASPWDGRAGSNPDRRAGGEAIRSGVWNLSGPYRPTFDDMLPDAVQVADPFHLVKRAKSKLDSVRRRVPERDRVSRSWKWFLGC